MRKYFRPDDSRGFFRRNRRALPLGFALLILAAAPVGRPWQEWLRSLLGREGMILLLGGVFFAAALTALSFINPGTIPRRKLILVALIFLAGFACSLTLPIPAERIHLLEYGILGGAAVAGFRREGEASWKSCGRALLFVFLVSLLDEGFQRLLPDRVGDWRDVGFNCLGGIWGIVLYLTAARRGLF